jgi:hypothetical protein
VAERQQRQNYIPARKPAVLAALGRMLADKADVSAFGRLTTLMGALIHHQYFDELERLREGYAVHADGGGTDESYGALSRDIDYVMRQANFIEISPEELDICDRETKGAPVRTSAPKWHYDTGCIYAPNCRNGFGRKNQRNSASTHLTTSSWWSGFAKLDRNVA